MLEAQLGYLVEMLRALERGRLASLEPRAEAQEDYVEWIRRRARGSVFEWGGCRSWYLDASGHSLLWPDFSWRFVRRLRRFDPGSYIATRARPARAAAAARAGT